MTIATISFIVFIITGLIIVFALRCLAMAKYADQIDQHGDKQC